MKTFAEISSREIHISKLRLDPNNPRLKLHPGGRTEKELIERLCRLGPQSPSQVIKHFLADRGYPHNEIPVVFKQAGKSDPIVIDGNRRMAALKMVHDPSLIPSTRRRLRADCESLKGLVPEQLRYWVTISVSDARRIVYRAHNEGTKEWETLARYATHYDYYKGGQAIADIAELTGSQQKNIRDEINVWILYEAMIQHIPEFLIEDEGITNFQRITTSFAGFSKRLGITLNPEGIYQMPADSSIVALIHKAFLRSAKTDRFTREVANNEESREAFWREILPKNFEPNTAEVSSTAKHSAVVTTVANADSAASPSNAQETKEGATATQKSGGESAPSEPLVSDRDILSTKKNVGKKSHAIFTEYVKLQQAGDFPIASAGLARAMIETTLKFHAKRLKCYEETSDQQQRHQSDQLDNVANRLKKAIAGMNLPYSADLVSSINNCTKAIPELNDVMHKDGSFAARPAVKTAFAALASSVESLVLIPDAK